MSERWRVLALMTGAQAGASVVQQALGSLSPVLVATFALNKAQLGVVFTAMYLGSMCFTAISGVLTDRWGERRLVLWSGVLMAFALLAAPLIPAYAWLAATIFVFGVGYAASTPAGGRAILAYFDRDRGFAMGIRQTGVPVGGLFGALTLPFVASAFGLRAAFVFAAIVLIVPTLVAYAWYREADSGGGEPASFGSIVRGMRTLVRDPRLLGVTLTCMVLVSTQISLNAFLTITAVTDVGLSAKIAALAFATAHVFATFGRLGWGYVSDRVLGGERLVPLAIICVLASLAMGTLAFLGRGAVVPLFVAGAVLGVSGAGWNGLFAAALAEVGGTERAASALGIGLTAIFGASAVAPAVFGAVADATSLRISWTAFATLALLGVIPVLWLRTHLAPARRSATGEG